MQILFQFFSFALPDKLFSFEPLRVKDGYLTVIKLSSLSFSPFARGLLQKVEENRAVSTNKKF
jgi:hypothetical protein